MLNPVLPSFIFIAEDGSETRLALPDQAGLIHARADFLRSQLPAGSAIGLMLPSGPDLVLDWMATLVAGLRPLVMQYPTAKQSRTYWNASVSNTVATVDLAAVVCDSYSRDLGMGELTTVILQDAMPTKPKAGAADLSIGPFEILQLSSGTTGFRKGIVFDSATLKRHAEDFGSALGFTSADRIVSWLPLYHDMGYIGCFVMPLILGIDVVMMDPMTWIRKPEMLFDAIERHSTTACFMPNFAYDLMSRGARRCVPSMRRWICAGEPISAATARRFVEAMGVDPGAFWPMYGMAENILGLSTRSGIQTQTIDGTEVISCGPPIPGLEFKVVEGEIWVRCATAIDAYLDGRRIKDADGFYATGDMGTLIDGEMYVNGRKQDLLIQAGRKFLLSDVDLRINELLPEVRGRAVALAVRDENLGTETLAALIEAPDFIERDDRLPVEAALRAACGIDQLEVAFVPPRFLTKTSSGKFNRKSSGGDWKARTTRNRAGAGGSDLLSVLDRYRAAAWDERVDTQFDSLSVTVLRSVMRDAGLKFDGALTPRQIEDSIRQAIHAKPQEKPQDTIRIVSMAERALFNAFRPKHFADLAAAIGRPVEFEHVCVPPSGIVLSDLVFQDYFSSRLPPEHFQSMGRVLDKLRNASVILADDTPELLWPSEQVYGVLSHNMERDPRADRISFRWQAYARQHDVLPLTVVCGVDMPLSNVSKIQRLLSKYLGVPLFRMANIPGFQEFTTDWEYRPFPANPYHGMDPDALVAALAAFLKGQPALKLKAAQQTTLFELSDPPHYCSHLVPQAPIDALVDRFDRFVLAGPSASTPYVRREIERKGKHYTQLMSFAPEVLATVPEPFDCLLTTGAIGPFPIDDKMRVAALQHIGRPWTTQNLDGIALNKNPEIIPVSRDWYYPLELDRQKNWKQWFDVRSEMELKSKKIRGAVV